MKITRKELKEIIHEVADELGLFEGLTKAQEKLPEPLKAAILKKQESDSDDSVEEGLTKAQEKLPEPLKAAILKKQEEDVDTDEISEGNAWGSAIRKAREENLNEFEFNGKVYTLTEVASIEEDSDDTEEFTGEHDEEVEEGNAFGDAVRKAKADGEDEFEVDGKTYKVTEGRAKNFQGCTLSETFARISGNKKIIT